MEWNDQTCSFETIKQKLIDFNQERDWSQFHGARNLAMAVTIEAGELLECFLWSLDDGTASMQKNRAAIEAEAADVLISLLNFCCAADIDIAAATQRKIAENALKYPVELAKGRSEKHNQLKVRDV